MELRAPGCTAGRPPSHYKNEHLHSRNTEMNNQYLNFSSPAGASAITPVVTLCLLDLSVSMDGHDFEPSRLEGGLQAIRAMLQEKKKSRPGDKLGVVGFSSRGSVICPPTNVGQDSAILRTLRRVESQWSTDFTAGFKLAKRLLDKEARVGRRGGGILRRMLGVGKPAQGASDVAFAAHIVFLSDGEHNGEGSPRQWAQKLKDAGVQIDCVGIGGSPAEVDEILLKAMASTGPDGKPRYRFIGDTASLVSDFRRMASLQIC